MHRLKANHAEVEGVVTLMAAVDDRLQQRVGHRWQMTSVSVRELPGGGDDDGVIAEAF